VILDALQLGGRGSHQRAEAPEEPAKAVFGFVDGIDAA
jgi:hypothetical protein